jgi:hypothetical protein
MKMSCPKCRQEYEVNESLLGKTLECECGFRFNALSKEDLYHTSSKNRRLIASVLLLIFLIILSALNTATVIFLKINNEQMSIVTEQIQSLRKIAKTQNNEKLLRIELSTAQANCALARQVVANTIEKNKEDAESIKRLTVLNKYEKLIYREKEEVELIVNHMKKNYKGIPISIDKHTGKAVFKYSDVEKIVSERQIERLKNAKEKLSKLEKECAEIEAKILMLYLTE